MTQRHPIVIQILGFDGCMGSAVVGLLDIFEIANTWSMAEGGGALFRTEVIAERAWVNGSAGVSIPASSLEGAAAANVAIVPPMMAPLEDVLQANEALVDWLRAAPPSTLLASVCAGAFLLGEAGRLDGLSATTNPAFAAKFRSRYPNVQLQLQERLIDHGGVICAGSTTAFLSLGIYLVDRFAGHAVAVNTAKALAVDKNHGNQLPYALDLPLSEHSDETINAVQEWVRQSYRSPIGVADMAARALMIQRTFHRRFSAATGMPPIDYLHLVRIGAAKKLLEVTPLTVEDITHQVGYLDARTFVRLFRRHVEVGPAEYRKRFGSTV